MFYEKFLTIIGKLPIEPFVVRRLSEIASTDPDRIYIENVRSALCLPYKVAEGLCDLAAFEGVLIRRFAYECPQCGKNLEVSEKLLDPGTTLDCINCHSYERDRSSFKVGEFKPVKVYGVRK